MTDFSLAGRRRPGKSTSVFDGCTLDKKPVLGSKAVDNTKLARRAELFCLIAVSSPRRKLSKPEADRAKKTSSVLSVPLW